MLGVLALLALAAAVAAPAPTPIEARIAARLSSFAGRMGVAAIHLETGETIAVNADERFPTASAIKTAVMVEVFHQIAAGRIRKDQLLTVTGEVKVGGSGVLYALRAGGQHSVSDLLYLMIALSDNTATNMLIALVGTRAVNDRMVAYGLPHTRLYRPTFRDGHPDAFPEEEREFGLGSSTPRETARLMETIARGKAVSREASAEMVAILAKQQNYDTIPRLLPLDDKVTYAGKSGQDDEKVADRPLYRAAVIRTSAILLMMCLAAGAQDAPPAAVRPVRKPKISWTLQFGLAHSHDDADHYAISGFQGRFPIFAFDRKDKSDRFGGLGIEVGAYPYPMTSRAYVPGPDADPDTPGKFNFWEAIGLSYYSPMIGPLQLEAGARLAFIDPAERVLTSPNGCGVSNRTEAHCNAYIKESLKTLDTILFPGFGGERGTVRFVAAALTIKGIGARIEAAQLNGGGSRVNARGLRFGFTVR